MDMNYTLELIDEAKIFLELYRDMLSPFSLDDNDRKSVHYHVVIEETDELVDIYPGEEEGTFVVLHEAHLVQESYGYVAGSGIEEMDESTAVCITFIIRRKGTAFIQEFFRDEEGNIDFEKTIQLSDEQFTKEIPMELIREIAAGVGENNAEELEWIIGQRWAIIVA